MDNTPRSQDMSPALSAGSKMKSGTGMSRELVSRHSGKVTFPESGFMGESHVYDASDDYEANRNPFKMPHETDIFALRDKERKKKKEERSKQRKLKVHEKTTYATRINSKTSSMIRPADIIEDKETPEVDDGKDVKDDPEFTLSVTRDRHVEKESLADYINKKREMFLVQYSLGVKRDEMRKLEEIAQAEERKLELAEQYLEEDAAMFDEFLKENDKNSVEAIKIAEQEIKAKEEKVREIQGINAQIAAIKSEIDNYEGQLQGYMRYKAFLEGLTPKEWLEEIMKVRNTKREAKRKERGQTQSSKKKREVSTPADSEMSAGRKRQTPGSKSRLSSRSGVSLKKTPGPAEEESMEESSESESDSDEEPELYFSDPQQLLDIFSELEEQNLSLIQNSQETEETLEEMKQTIKHTKIKMEKETEVLQDQIEKLKNSIKREEEKAKELEIRARMFSFGEFKAEDQEKMLRELNRKVTDVYRSCIGDNEANISTLQMLTNIENRLEDLFAEIEMMPQDKVEAAEKAKEKERRLKMREEKIEQQRIHQEERVRRALERAKADPKRTTGRRLVARSEPPQLKKHEDEAADQASREEEELAYYFTP